MNDTIKRSIDYGFKAHKASQEEKDPMRVIALYQLAFWNLLSEVRKENVKLNNYVNKKEEEL